jgi:hypothetical protein
VTVWTAGAVHTLEEVLHEEAIETKLSLQTGYFIRQTDFADINIEMDLSHHINAKSKARHPSPLKDIIKFMGQDGMISLAGGE